MTPDRGSPQAMGERLLTARELRGITQGLAADHLGISQPTLIAIEAGDRRATPAEIVKLAEFYGRPVHWFVRTVDSISPCSPAEANSGLVSSNRFEFAPAEHHQWLAVEAYERGELSEKELANQLHCDLWEARQRVKDWLQSREADSHDSTPAHAIDLSSPARLEQTPPRDSRE